MMRAIFVCKIVPFDTNFFISIMFEHGCTKIRIPQETIMDSFEMLLDASLFSNYGLDDLFFVVEFSHICGHEVVNS